MVVRGKIEVNPLTAAMTITTDPPGTPDAIPTSIEGIPLEIQHVNATTTRSNFQFNPTNCARWQSPGTIHSSEGGDGHDRSAVPGHELRGAEVRTEVRVSTRAKTSKADGASLTAKVTRAERAAGHHADIAKVKVELPKQLPSRLTTLQKACTAAQFEANPAGCPAASEIGHVRSSTPVLPVPLEGPAYFVSHGGEAFPSLIVVLQGDDVTIELVGTTFISKAGVTSDVQDGPRRAVELRTDPPRGQVLRPRGERQPLRAKLALPTEFVAQNGAVLKQSTPISVTGCARSRRSPRTESTGSKGTSRKPSRRRGRARTLRAVGIHRGVIVTGAENGETTPIRSGSCAYSAAWLAA